MTNLLNKFIIVGDLIECRIDLYSTHIKCKMNIKTSNKFITIYHSINRKFHEDKYLYIEKLIPYLHPKSKGIVWVNDKKYYELTKGETKMFFSGNITERRDNIFFNAEYFKLTNIKDKIEISLEGIWLDNGFMNIVSDSPRIFNLKPLTYSSDVVYKINVEYNNGWTIENDIVKSLEKSGNLIVKYTEKCDKHLGDKDIKNWLLEWSIINGE